MEQLKTLEMKTALYDQHLALGAKMVDFYGWKMPLQYTNIREEHQTVRRHVGIFDVSHMGRVLIFGKEAEQFLDYLATSHIAGKKERSATYTVLCNVSGGCVDDVIIYKFDREHFFVVVNAGNREKDLTHIKNEALRFDVKIQDRYKEDGILAIQGPQSNVVLSKIFPKVPELKHMHFCQEEYQHHQIILAYTGYTGERGYEIYAENLIIPELWNHILEEGKTEGIKPIGLAARDTLRLEMGFALYGHELTENIVVTESVASWTVKWDKQDFMGKTALELLEKANKRHEVGLMIKEGGIAREGYQVLKENEQIGSITSGTFSPTLNKAIAIALVNQQLNPGQMVEVAIREKKVPAEVTSLPFLKKE